MSRENDKNREQCHQNHKPLIRDRNMQRIYVLRRPLLILLGERDPLQLPNISPLLYLPNPLIMEAPLPHYM